MSSCWHELAAGKQTEVFQPQRHDFSNLKSRVTRRPSSKPDRPRGICWRVHDIDATRARLAAAGVDVSEVRIGRKPGTRVMTVKSGTCGVPTLLVQPAPKLATAVCSSTR